MATETVVIIVPTYNEKGNIERLIKILEEKVFPLIAQNFDMHVLVVDDSSPDGTGQIVADLVNNHPKLHLLTNPKKLGLGYAYMKGMDYALNNLKAQIVFEFDADLSHDPTKIPPMLDKLSEGFDMVLGSRYVPGGAIPANWGVHRKFLSIVGNLVARIIATDFQIHDWTGGFRGIKRQVIEAVLPKMNRGELFGYTFQIGFLLQARKLGFSVAEVAFHFKDRTLGKSKMPASYITKTLGYLIRVRLKDLYTHRLFKFAIVGVIGALVQLSTLQLFRLWLPYQLAYFFSVELAVISNFIWSNLWTFADRPLALIELPGKFIQFNLGSAGSILIQQILAFGVERYIGIKPLIFLPIDTGFFFAIIGIGLGMFWNYFIYSKIIWKQQNKRTSSQL